MRHQLQEFALADVELAALVRQDLRQPEQHDRRGVWEHLDGPPLRAGVWVHIEVQPLGEDLTAWRVELRSAPICGARTRVELREVAVDSAVSHGRAPVSFGTISGASMATRHSSPSKRSDGGFDARVVVGDSDVQESSIGIDNCHASLVLLAPCKIQSNEVHRATVPYAA